MPSFIADGFTLTGYVAPEAGIHDGLSFTYRPGLPVENRTVVEEQGLAAGVKEDRIRKYLADHLKEWNLVYPDHPSVPEAGKAVPITADNCGRINGKLRTAILDILMGWSASDKDPGAQAGN